MHRVLADFVASYIGVLLAVAAPTPTSPEPQATLREHTRYELSNGLTVILHPVDDVPLVRVHVRYHVGGADEPLHRRGIAHIVEHLTFEGSEHISADARARALFYIGALDDNATTSLTSTDYFLTVPSEYTEMALWLESERMGYSSATVTRENLRAVQRVVANERRERIDAEPYASLQVHLAKALYPTSHPFHSHHIGSLFDIANATPGEAREFVRDWYVPANATLVLVGDLPPVTRTWVEKYFGSLARTVAAPRPAVAAIDPGREVVVNIIEPLGKSPVITDGEVTVAETGAIIEYLIDTHGGGRLRPPPGTPAARQFTYWLHYAEGSAMPPLLLKLIFDRIAATPMPFFAKPVARRIVDGVMSAFVTPSLRLHLDFLESALAGQPWFCGADFTAADVMLSFPLEAAAQRAGLDASRPALMGFLQRIHARPAYQRALERGGPYAYA